MKCHVVVSIYQGCAEGVQVFTDKTDAEIAFIKTKAELGIEKGGESESENTAEVFYDVPIKSGGG